MTLSLKLLKKKSKAATFFCIFPVMYRLKALILTRYRDIRVFSSLPGISVSID